MYGGHLRMQDTPSQSGHRRLVIQFGVFGFGGDEDGDVRVGVFPEGEEI